MIGRKKKRRFFEPWEEWFEFPEFEFPRISWFPHWARSLTGVKTPLLDIEDRGKELLVVVDMPGLNKNDIDIEVEPNYIKISAESRYKEEEKKKEYYYQERRYAGFSRAITLPEEVVPDKAKAEYKNGILRVYLPKLKPKKKKGKKVKVE